MLHYRFAQQARANTDRGRDAYRYARYEGQSVGSPKTPFGKLGGYLRAEDFQGLIITERMPTGVQASLYSHAKK